MEQKERPPARDIGAPRAYGSIRKESEMNNAGYKGAVNTKSGLKGWQKAGHPIQH